MSINSTSDLQAKYENDYIHWGTFIEEHYKSKSCNNVSYDGMVNHLSDRWFEIFTAMHRTPKSTLWMI